MAPAVLLALLTLVAADRARAEVFTSTAHLAHVLAAEGEVVQLLREFVAATEAKLARVQRYIADFERYPVDGSEGEGPVGDPLGVFQLMKRLTVDWTAVEQILHDSSWADVHRAVTGRRLELVMPQEEDLQGAALALVRLQETYNLQVSELARGEILGLHSSNGLSARDCLFLGKHSFHVGLLNFAIQWYDQALLKSRQEGNSTAGEEEIRPFLQQALTAHEQASGEGARDTSVQNGQTTAEHDPPFVLGRDISYQDDQRNYRALCQGLKIRSPEVESRLHCYFSDRGDPYFRLHPVKVEESNADPPVYTFHDVISDAEIEHVKQFARPQLERSTVIATDGVGREVSTVRTSQNAWLFDSLQDDSVKALFHRIMRRVSLITGLKTVGEQNAEALQVANYGIAGHYIPHHDYIFKDKTPEQLSRIPPSDLSTGDRIATFMFYLSDVTRGGATVFPRMGAAVWPQKGAAAFWYNLRRSGEPDPLTLHGACPVVHGSKWVGNKWIRERNQLFSRPCGLSAAE